MTYNVQPRMQPFLKIAILCEGAAAESPSGRLGDGPGAAGFAGMRACETRPGARHRLTIRVPFLVLGAIIVVYWEYLLLLCVPSIVVLLLTIISPVIIFDSRVFGFYCLEYWIWDRS